MSYKSPIEIAITQMRIEQERKIESSILNAVQEMGITVNKEQLLHALRYDRDQYQKGYNDGYDDGFDKGYDADKWISVEVKLPKDREWVLVWHTGYKTPKKAKHKIDTDPYLPIFILDGDNDLPGEVTHWQPLPAPPKERTDD